jgi:DNA-binding NtrC family response regulator
MKTKIVIFAEDESHTALSLANNLVYPLKEVGLKLLVYTDADAALSVIKDTDHYQIVGAIIDLWMIDKTTGSENTEKGQELINTLKRCHPDVKVVVLSSHITANDKQEFEKMKGVSAFRKPASTNEIYEALMNGNS